MQERVINPFINNTVVPFIEVINEIRPNGYGMNMVKDSYEIEADPYIRVYTERSRRMFMFSLSMYARDMIMAIQYFLHSDNRYVVLSHEKIVELYQGEKYGKRRFDETIKELHKFALIDLKDKSVNQYWYNPVFFAAGSRLTIYPECKLKVKTVTKHT